MERTNAARRLRIAWTAWWAIVCVLLVGLWVRSYWLTDELSFRVDTLVAWGVSQPGGMQFCYLRDICSGKPEFEFQASRAQRIERKNPTFVVHFDRRFRYIASPHWCPVLLTATLTVLPWLRWTFSLRTLMVATSIIAIVMGWVAWSFRG